MTATTAQDAQTTGLPAAIYALAAVNVAIGTQSFAFAGLLAELAADLRITLGVAGILVAAAAITFAIGAPLAAMLLAQRERRSVILTALIALATVNAFCAFAPSFGPLLALRVAAGVATAFLGAVTTAAAAALVPPERRGRAFAIVIGGMTVAFVAGVPIGSALGGLLGWRATFLFAAIICLLAMGLALALVPPIPAVSSERVAIRDVLSNGAVVQLLAITLICFTAMFTVVAYIGPIITHATGATGRGVGALQVFIGLGSVVGLGLGGFAADRGLGRSLGLAAFSVMCLTLAAYWFVLSAPAGSVPSALLALHIFVGAAALFSLMPVTLAGLSIVAGRAAPLALALNSSLVSLGQGLGAIVGGALTDLIGPASKSIGGAVLAFLGLMLATRLQASRP